MTKSKQKAQCCFSKFLDTDTLQNYHFTKPQRGGGFIEANYSDKQNPGSHIHGTGGWRFHIYHTFNSHFNQFFQFQEENILLEFNCFEIRICRIYFGCVSDTFSKIYIHCVFAVRGRENLIGPSIRDRVHSYISSGLKNEGVYPLAVGGWKDHVHVLFTLKPNQNISYIMQSVISNSSKWINSNGLIKSKFHWQAGFGAFSCSEDGVDGLIKYIMNQEAHHSKKSFKEEFYEMLKEFNIEYDERFIFEFYNED